MVSFQCDGCADTVKKPKLDQHRNRCFASFTCLDCSTTFHDQSYKSHTTCISEAEKYEGALYKGKKGKNGSGPNKFQAQPTIPTSSQPEPAPTPSAPAAAPTIHPSRAAVIAAPTPGPSNHSAPAYGRGGYGGRGRGAFGGGRGGRGGGFGGGPGGAAAGGASDYVRYSATGENNSRPAGGMRSWGTNTPVEGTPAPVSAAPTPTSAPTAAVPAPTSEKPKKKKKGDKGGTGARANSKHPRGDTAEPSAAFATPATQDEPESKKRKRSGSASVPAVDGAIDSSATQEAPSEKTLKRLRKNLSKLESEPESTSSLADVLAKLAKGKKDSPAMSSDEVLKGLKVGFVNGKWTLSV